MGTLSKLYGYARVSTKEQNTDRQYFALMEAGVIKSNIFTDKQTGREFDRKAYSKLLRKLKPDDLLIITSIDRLGRNYRAILEQWRYITQELKAHIKVLDMPILDTTNQGDGVLGMFICDIVLQILSYLADSTWENIKASQRQGIERAKEAGKHLGRPRTEYPENFADTYAKWKNNDITTKTAMETSGLTARVFYRMVKEYAEQRGVYGKIRKD